MAITFFGVASTPADGSATTNTTDPTVITPPGSMVSGDLVFVYATKRVASGTISVSQAGGQTWNSGTTFNSGVAVLSGNWFWCRFNGTWSANPSFSFSSTTNNIAVMLVFRPSSGADSWAVDPSKTGTFANKSVVATEVFNGWTPTNANNVNIAFVGTDDDNTWTVSGTNWTQTGISAQYRNTSGSDASQSLIYQIQNGAAALTNDVTFTEATLGNDGGVAAQICFYEVAAAAFIAARPYIINQSVNRSTTY